MNGLCGKEYKYASPSHGGDDDVKDLCSLFVESPLFISTGCFCLYGIKLLSLAPLQTSTRVLYFFPLAWQMPPSVASVSFACSQLDHALTSPRPPGKTGRAVDARVDDIPSSDTSAGEAFCDAVHQPSLSLVPTKRTAQLRFSDVPPVPTAVQNPFHSFFPPRHRRS